MAESEEELKRLLMKVKEESENVGPLIQRSDSFEKTPMLGKIEGRRRRGRQDEMFRWHHRLNEHEFG